MLAGMRGRKLRRLFCVLVLGACGPAGSERAAPPASETPAAAAPAAVTVPAGDSVEGLVQAFARGDVADVGGDASLRAWVREFVVGLKGGDEPIEIAFVVDRSLGVNAAQSLALAAAGARPEFPLKMGRAGLVSYAAGGGGWVTRVEAPLAEGLPGVIGAAMRVEWAPDGGAGIGGGWAGLAEAMRLEWRVPPGRRHVVLLLDDRATDGLRVNPWPADDPALRTKVAAWGRDAVLHVVRSRLELADGRGRGPEAPLDPGVPPAVIAGLVRNGRHTVVDTPAPMRAAVSGGLEALAGGPADVAIVVHRIGTDLAALRPAIDRFMAGPEHRLALLHWDAAGVEVLAGLTGDAGVAVRALGKLRAVRPEMRARPVFTALAAAQGLAWQPAARKVVIVLTAAPALVTAEAAAVLAWTEAAEVTVYIVELAPGRATASAPGP
jgi:hypothetical protein